MAPATSGVPVVWEERILSLPLVPGELHPLTAYATAEEATEVASQTRKGPYATRTFEPFAYALTLYQGDILPTPVLVQPSRRRGKTHAPSPAGPPLQVLYYPPEGEGVTVFNSLPTRPSGTGT